MYGFPLWTHVQVSLKGRGGAVRPPEPHPSCTKMSLTLVFAPVEVLQEMAAPLPVSPQPLLSYKISQQTHFKVCLCLFSTVCARQMRASGGVFMAWGGRVLEVDHPKSEACGRSGGGGRSTHFLLDSRRGDVAPPPSSQG